MDWCERQRAAVLPVTYHHLVFTLPHVLDGWVEVHPKEIYALLFETAWAILSAFGADPKRLDGQMGMIKVLHTRGQTLVRHVHLHCLVPGGAFSTGERLGAPGPQHLPVSGAGTSLKHFRGRFVSRDPAQCLRGRSTPTHPRSCAEVDRILNALMGTEWSVYSKPCLARTETVVDYLARYSHRIALADSRILGFESGEVTLSYKDYRDGDRRKVMTLSGEELLRRFLLHVLPKGFMRIRHYGFLANRCRAKRLRQIRSALEVPDPEPVEPQEDTGTGAFDGYPCPKCRSGRLHIAGRIAPERRAGVIRGLNHRP